MNEVTFTDPILKPIYYGLYSDLFLMERIEGNKAVVDANTNYVYAIVSDNYRLLRHETAIEELETALVKHPELGRHDVNTQFHNEGGKMKRIYTFPDVQVEVGKSDRVNMELHLLNSIDGSWKFSVMLGGFRLVCSNGLVIGKKFMEMSSRHYGRHFSYDVEEQLNTAIMRFTDQTELWKRWLDRATTSQDYENAVKNLNLGKRAIKYLDGEIRTETGKNVIRNEEGIVEFVPFITYWIFYNMLTAYITHHVKSLARRVELQKNFSRML